MDLSATEAVKYIGLDVHNETIAVAVADGEPGGEVRYVGTVPAREERRYRERVADLSGEIQAIG